VPQKYGIAEKKRAALGTRAALGRRDIGCYQQLEATVAAAASAAVATA
jgi:hypothetical protein